MFSVQSRSMYELPKSVAVSSQWRLGRSPAVPAVMRMLPVVSLAGALLTVAAAALAGPSPGVILLASAWVVLISTTVLLFGMKAFPPLWQTLAGAALAGYVILNWGFANFTVAHTGIPVGHVLAITALMLLVVRSDKRGLSRFLKEPTALWWLCLLGLSIPHLLFDFPQYGTWAVRDASFVLEGIFLLLGFLWARGAQDPRPVLAALAVLFLLNTAYSLTLPMASALVQMSPVSGIFQPVPLLGSYAHTPLFLVAGAFFYLLVARYLGWPRGIILSLALFQFGWSLVFQSRYSYLGLLAALLSMGFVGRVRQSARAASLMGGGIVIFFVLIGVSGLQIQGRVGEAVGPDFLWRHFSSIFLVPDTPRVGSAQWRLDLLPELKARWTASTARIFFGEGFGQPIIDFHNAGPNPVRQPHNTHLTVIVRLGAVGFLIWLVMQWTILSSLVRSIRHLRQNTLAHDFALWILVLYVLLMVTTTFEPELEFSYGAIPFYTFMGFALGLARNRSVPVVAEGARGEVLQPQDWALDQPGFRAGAFGTIPAPRFSNLVGNASARAYGSRS